MHSGRCWQTVLATCLLLLMSLDAAPPLCASEPGAVAQDPARKVVGDLVDLLTQIQNREISDVSSSLRDLAWLRRAAGPGVNGAMVKALGADADVLRAVLTGAAGNPQQAIASVAEDLALKTAYCRANAAGMNAVVKLTVRTWSGADVAPRWQVAYLSAPLAVLRRADAEQFPQFSSPTSMSLPPGRYVIWAQDPADASRRGPSKEVALGEHGRDAVEVDVLVARR